MLDIETKYGFKSQKLFIQFDDVRAKDFHFDFKFIFDLGGRSLVIYNEKEKTLKKRVIFGHMCTDPAVFRSESINNPRALLLSYRELIAFDNEEVVSAQVDNEKSPTCIFIALKSGAIYMVSIKALSQHFIQTTNSNRCDGVTYAKWAARSNEYPPSPSSKCTQMASASFGDD